MPPKEPDHFGAVAQLGERLVRNEEVSGSIPLGSTIPKVVFTLKFNNLELWRRRGLPAR